MAAIVAAALFANAINLERVPGSQVMIFAPDLLLELPHLRREEFHRTATFRAHHVMVAAPVVLMLKAGNSIVKRNFTGQAAFGQQFQRPVHGGISDACVFLLHQAVQFVGRQMIPRLQETPQNGIALLGLFQPDVLQMAVQDLFRLAHHLARKAWLVIDALLQHGGSEVSE